MGDTTLLLRGRAHPLEVVGVTTAVGAAIGTLIDCLVEVDRWREVGHRYWTVGSAAVGVDVARKRLNVSLRF